MPLSGGALQFRAAGAGHDDGRAKREAIASGNDFIVRALFYGLLLLQLHCDKHLAEILCSTLQLGILELWRLHRLVHATKKLVFGDVSVHAPNIHVVFVQLIDGGRSQKSHVHDHFVL